MLICGIKLGHDASIALIDNARLVFSHELEKINNGPRHSSFTLSNQEVADLIARFGYKMEDVDSIVFDGWHPTLQQYLQGRHPGLQLAGYGSYLDGADLLAETPSAIESYASINCKSYRHVAGHIAGTYCASPFAAAGEDAFILVWDGGMFPQLYHYNAQTNYFSGVKDLFPLTAMVYACFAHKFPPFDQYKDCNDFAIPGKVMAFAALGNVRQELLDKWQTAFDSWQPPYITPTDADLHKQNIHCIDVLLDEEIMNNYSSPDVIASFQKFIEILLIDHLAAACKAWPVKTTNLCITGGAALNITWNSAIRDSGLFDDVWVPPFPNDAGSAIGAACCEMLKYTASRALTWNAYSGPALMDTAIDPAWESMPCSIKQLATLLHTENEPVVLLNGNAELGPRALGNRSIVASPASGVMKHLLNTVKVREYYRPVAPICLEEDAPEVFEPGTPDPYMLFTHKTREAWLSRIPAICHLDGTARLQTVNERDNPLVYELLQEFKAVSNIPLLCNTSANFNGKGFFPDVQSALAWGGVNLVWSNGSLFMKKGYSRYLYLPIIQEEETALTNMI